MFIDTTASIDPFLLRNLNFLPLFISFSLCSSVKLGSLLTNPKDDCWIIAPPALCTLIVLSFINDINLDCNQVCSDNADNLVFNNPV